MESVILVAMGTKNIQEGQPALSIVLSFLCCIFYFILSTLV